MSRKNYALLEAGWIPGHLDAFKPNATGKIRLYDSGGGGGSPAPSSVSQTTIPEYAQPYAERLLGQAEAKIFTKDAGTGEITGFQPYQTYGGERLAPSTQEQQAVRQQVAGMQGPQQFGTGTQLATQAGIGALGAGQYQPGVFAAPLTQAQQLRQFQMRAAPNVAGRDVTTGSFTAPGTAEQFMSPYMQQALDVQKQEAIRTAQQGQLAQNLAAAKTGTYGGARQTLAMTERERNLQELNRIQAMGSQSAYEQAQRAFEQEQGRGLQAQQLSGQFGMQAALANQQAAQQAALQNLQARLGVQQLGAQTGLESQRLNQAALLDAQKLAEQSRQYGAGLGLQGAQAATQAAATLGQLGIGQQQQALDLAKAQEAFGGLGRAEQQAKMDLAYQDFLQQQRYPFSQLGFMSDILRGSGNLAATGGRAIYEQPPSTTQQLMQLGLGGLGLYRAMGAGA
jgi:hypothetical protein